MVLRLEESVGVDDGTQADFLQRLRAVLAKAPAVGVLRGSRRIVGLQLQAKKA